MKGRKREKKNKKKESSVITEQEEANSEPSVPDQCAKFGGERETERQRKRGIEGGRMKDGDHRAYF